MPLQQLSNDYLQFDCQQTECPRFEERQCVRTAVKQPVGVGTPSVDVLFITEAPGDDETEGGHAAAGQAGALIKETLEYIDATPNGYAIIPVIRCVTPVAENGHNRRPSKDEIDNCRVHLKADILRVNPKVIVLCGLPAMQAFMPDIRTPNGWWNRVTTIKVGEKQYDAVVVFPPMSVTRSPHSISFFIEGVNKAVDIATNGNASVYHPSRWQITPTVEYCDTIDKVKNMVEFLLHRTTNEQVCGFDVETRNVNARYGNQLVMLQFGVDPKHIYCVPYQYIHAVWSADELAELKVLLSKLFTETPNFKYWVTHFGVFEQLQISQFILDGKTFSNRPMVDTGGLVYLTDENRVRLMNEFGIGLALKSDANKKGGTSSSLALELLGRNTYQQRAVEARSGGDLWKLPPEDLLPYAADDVVNTLLIYEYCRLIAKSQGYLSKMMRLASVLFSRAFRLFATLKRNGFFLDLDHMRLLYSPDSPILGRIAEIVAELKKLPTVKAANKVLAKKSSGGMKPIFDFGDPWVFNVNKKDHVVELLINQLKLSPLAWGKEDRNGITLPSIDDEFYEHYAPMLDDEAGPLEVRLVREFVELKKLSTTYTKALIKRIDPSYNDIDCCTDGRVRADFGFINTVTGRPSCRGPNIQAVTRASNAARAMIKSIFAAMQSHGAHRKPLEVVTTKPLDKESVDDFLAAVVDDVINDEDDDIDASDVMPSYNHTAASVAAHSVVDRTLIQADFRAAEVRVWGNMAQDPILGGVFLAGKKLRDEYRANPTEELKERAEWEGDVHRSTAANTFKKSIRSITKNERQDMKSIVFGLIAARGVKSIAEQLGRAGSDEEVAEVSKLCDGVMGVYERGSQWLDECDEIASQQYYLESPIGRLRRLPVYMFKRLIKTVEFRSDTYRMYKATVGEARRLARNSGIQGFSSDITILAVSLLMEYIEENNKDWKIVNVVHDSCVIEASVDELELAVEIIERCFTVDVMQLINDVWGMNWMCPVEVEFEVGVRWGEMMSWDSSAPHLQKIKTWLKSGGIKEFKSKKKSAPPVTVAVTA